MPTRITQHPYCQQWRFFPTSVYPPPPKAPAQTEGDQCAEQQRLFIPPSRLNPPDAYRAYPIPPASGCGQDDHVQLKRDLPNLNVSKSHPPASLLEASNCALRCRVSYLWNFPNTSPLTLLAPRLTLHYLSPPPHSLSWPCPRL
jgi:hypothetical protein